MVWYMSSFLNTYIPRTVSVSGQTLSLSLLVCLEAAHQVKKLVSQDPWSNSRLLQEYTSQILSLLNSSLMHSVGVKDPSLRLIVFCHMSCKLCTHWARKSVQDKSLDVSPKE